MEASATLGARTSVQVVQDCARILTQTFCAVSPAGGACALLDYPNHSNVGDSLIWQGVRRLLEDRGYQIKYTCSVKSFDADRMRGSLPAGAPIFFNGGGNF